MVLLLQIRYCSCENCFHSLWISCTYRECRHFHRPISFLVQRFHDGSKIGKLSIDMVSEWTEDQTSFSILCCIPSRNTRMWVWAHSVKNGFRKTENEPAPHFQGKQALRHASGSFAFRDYQLYDIDLSSLYGLFGRGNNCITYALWGFITSLHCVFALKVRACSETLMDMRWQSHCFFFDIDLCRSWCNKHR